MTQLTLPLPPSSGDLPWDNQGNTEMLSEWGIKLTSCAVCDTRIAQRAAKPIYDGEHVCSTDCKTIYIGWIVG